MNKASEVLFKTTISHFGLFVDLRVIGRTHFQCGVGQSKELLPEATNENGIPITYDGLWHFMIADSKCCNLS